MNEIQIALHLKASEGTGEARKELLFALGLSCLAQHLSSSSNFMLLPTRFRISSASTVHRVLSYKSHQTFESLSHFSL